MLIYKNKRLQIAKIIIILLFCFIVIKLKSHVNKNSNFNEINTDNFVCRWAFQKICDFVFDPYDNPGFLPSVTTPGGIQFNPEETKAGDVIFVRNVSLFFKQMDPQIKFPYIIITHGHYRDAFIQPYLKYLKNPKIIAWFGIHYSIKTKHDKFFPIPLGIYHPREFYDKKINWNIKFRLFRRKAKSQLLYINFNKSAHRERKIALDFFKDKKFCRIATKKDFYSYLLEMSNFKFVLCPEGIACDTHRVWEALLVGSIPIVKTSTLDDLYKEFPILIINNWEEITEDFLNLKYKEITLTEHSLEPLYIEYWKKRINQIKESFLKKYNQKVERIYEIKN